MIGDVLVKNADAVAGYRAGKTATFGFLVGQVMKAAAGKANPKRVNELLKRALETT
jgi:aspartyl-tRNA(Asn)/glutamyl-tRNA(Gln) amidotransferase subunit B